MALHRPEGTGGRPVVGGPGIRAARLSLPVLRCMPGGLGLDLSEPGTWAAVHRGGRRGTCPRQPPTDTKQATRGGSGRRAGGPGGWRGGSGWLAQGQLGPWAGGTQRAPARCPRLGAPPDLALGEAAHEDPVVPSAGPGVLSRLHVLLRLGERETGAAGGAQPQAQSSGCPPRNKPEGVGARAGGAAAAPGLWKPGPPLPGGRRGRCRGPGSKTGVEGSAGPPGHVALNPFRPQFRLFSPRRVSV